MYLAALPRNFIWAHNSLVLSKKISHCVYKKLFNNRQAPLWLWIGTCSQQQQHQLLRKGLARIAYKSIKLIKTGEAQFFPQAGDWPAATSYVLWSSMKMGERREAFRNFPPSRGFVVLELYPHMGTNPGTRDADASSVQPPEHWYSTSMT